MVFYIIIALLFAIGLASVGGILSNKGLTVLRGMQVFSDPKPTDSREPALLDTRAPSFTPSPEGESPLYWPSVKKESPSSLDYELQWPSKGSQDRFREPLIDYDDESAEIHDAKASTEDKAPFVLKRPEEVSSPLTMELIVGNTTEANQAESTDTSQRPNSDEVRALVQKVGLSQAVQRLRNSENMSFQEATEFLARSLRR